MVKSVSENKFGKFKSEIAGALARQFKGMWAMLRQAVEQVPSDYWIRGKDNWCYSLRVYHIIEAAAYYSRETPKGMKWGERLGTVDWWEKMTAKEAAQKLTKQDMKAYLDEMDERIEAVLAASTDESLLEQDGFHWFSSPLEKLQYLLRHSSYHIGELALALREWDCERIKWK